MAYKINPKTQKCEAVIDSASNKSWLPCNASQVGTKVTDSKNSSTTTGLSNYKVDPNTGICVQVVNPQGETFKGWKDCTSANLGKKVMEPYTPETGLFSANWDPNKKNETEEDTGTKTPEQIELARVQKNRKMWKTVGIVGGVVAFLAIASTLIYKSMKNNSATPPAV